MPRSAPSTRPCRSPCPVANSLDLLGDRWTLLVIRDLFFGKKRYGEFAAGWEKIPTNLLAERLRRLEAAGIVQSSPYQENPPRFDYQLTESGTALRPVLQELANWGRRYLPAATARAGVSRSAGTPPTPPRKSKKQSR